MVCLSFNARGVGGTHKQQALKGMFPVYKPHLVLFQETVSRVKSHVYFVNYSFKLDFFFIDVKGLSSEKMTCWCQGFKLYFNPYIWNINIYGPYGER